MADPTKKMVLAGFAGPEKCKLAFDEDTAVPANAARDEVGLVLTVNGQSRRIAFNEDVALTVSVGDRKRQISFKELTLSNNFALEALVKLLVDKKIIDVKDLQQAMNEVRDQRYQMPGGQDLTK
jgi:hypothetical protein